MAVQKIHVHHPALLRIAKVTPQGEQIILDGIESDVVFPIDCPATIRVTTLTGESYKYKIPEVKAMPPCIIEHLDDIGDVSVPSPLDGDLFYYDQASGLWKSRKLADADIPVTIARDSEVSSAIDTHAALATNVHGIQDVPLFSSEAKTYYVDATNGDDSNSGEASDDAFKTWGKLESMIPMFILHDYTVYIIGDMPENVNLRGRIISGDATLTIRGITDTPSNHEVGGIYLYSVVGDYQVQYLRATDIIKLRGCSGGGIFSMYKLEPRAPAASAQWAINVTSGFAYIRECDFGSSVVKDCIYVDSAMVCSRDNTGNAQRYGLHARGGGVIGKKGTQPTGSSANEYTADGGVIR